MVDKISPIFQIYDWYRSARSSEPVCRDETFGGWRVLRYHDVREVLADHATFGSARPGGHHAAEGIIDPGEDTMVRADPPHHRYLRGVVSKAFTPRTVAGLAPLITRVSSELLDTALAHDETEVVGEVAYPLPLAVITTLLGISLDRSEEFRRWSNAIVAGGGGVTQDRSEVDGMFAFFTEVIEERRRTPGGDLISQLLAAEHEGEHLTQRQVLNFCALMLVAGHETTTNLITNAVLCLAQRPDVLEAVRSDLDLVPGVIEEVLRYASPVQAVVRYARQDCVLGGQQVTAGEVVFPSLGSAHRDPAAFSDPDDFLISREHGMEIPFGHGIHYCIGAPLARLEAGIMLPMLVERLPGQWTVTELDFDPTLQRFLFAARRMVIQRAAAIIA